MKELSNQIFNSVNVNNHLNSDNKTDLPSGKFILVLKIIVLFINS